MNLNHNEKWKTIQEYPNYEVSNRGNVRSKDRIVVRKGHKTILKGKLLKQYCGGGYMRVALYNGNRGSRVNKSVHRLVAQAFVENPSNLIIINHKDENKLNNNAENLEWCTYKYNSNYGTAIKRRVLNQNWNDISLKLSKPVVQMDKDFNVIAVYKSCVSCKKFGFNSASISKCCTGKLKTYKGYIWRYKNECD